MTTPIPDPADDRDLVSPVDHALADALRGAARAWCAVPDEVADRHLAAITALAGDHAHAAVRPPAPTWRNRMRRLAGLTIVKVAVGAGAAAAATTGGLAAGGHLPDPVQGAVADSVDWMGIDLPRPEPEQSDAEDVVPTPSPDVPAEAPVRDDQPGDVGVEDDDDTPTPAPSTAPPRHVPASPSAEDRPGRDDAGPDQSPGPDAPQGADDEPPGPPDDVPPASPGSSEDVPPDADEPDRSTSRVPDGDDPGAPRR